MSFLLDALRQHFGHDGFRAGREALVRAVIESRDLLAVMPTGSGKSLGYQLPAVVLPGTTIVVSPLISLMKDQVDQLGRRGIAAAALHAVFGGTERRDPGERQEAGPALEGALRSWRIGLARRQGVPRPWSSATRRDGPSMRRACGPRVNC